MIYLDINFDRYTYENITGKTYQRYGTNLDFKAFLQSLSFPTKVTVDMADFDKINVTASSLVKGDKVFIMPGVTIPRYKLREKGKADGFDIVRNISKATKIVYSKQQFITECIHKKHFNTVKIDDLIEIFNAYNINVPAFSLAGIETDVIIPYDVFSTMRDIYLTVASNTTIESFTGNYTYVYDIKDPIYLNTLNDLITTNIIIVDEKDVLKQCNGSKPLDEDAYNRLVSMFKTSQNQEIALELLCNCDYDQSMLYILKLTSLFNFHSLPGTNHVNYKAFRKYLINNWNIDPNHYGGDIVDIISVLAENGKLKREYLVQYKNEILEHVQRRGNNKIFKVASITMEESYKEKIIE